MSPDGNACIELAIENLKKDTAPWRKRLAAMPESSQETGWEADRLEGMLFAIDVLIDKAEGLARVASAEGYEPNAGHSGMLAEQCLHAGANILGVQRQVESTAALNQERERIAPGLPSDLDIHFVIVGDEIDSIHLDPQKAADEAERQRDYIAAAGDALSAVVRVLDTHISVDAVTVAHALETHPSLENESEGPGL